LAPYQVYFIAMSTITEEIVTSERVTEMALVLTPHEQAVLLARLHENLESMERDSEYEAAWGAEIERRVREVENGEVELIDHDVVMKEAREHLAKLRLARQ
jgi:putative addiction module component (TIGR02574 family)